MKKRKLRIRPRNEAARTLRDPHFRKRVVRSKHAYTRKGNYRHQQLHYDGGHY